MEGPVHYERYISEDPDGGFVQKLGEKTVKIEFSGRWGSESVPPGL